MFLLQSDYGSAQTHPQAGFERANGAVIGVLPFRGLEVASQRWFSRCCCGCMASLADHMEDVCGGNVIKADLLHSCICGIQKPKSTPCES